MRIVNWAPKQWWNSVGNAVRNPGQALSAADRAIQDQAAARSAQNQQAGFARNQTFLESQPADTVARQLVSQKVKLPGAFGMAGSLPDSQAIDELTKLIEVEGNRRALAESGVHYQMNRGRMRGGQGFMEAVNSGIATNPFVRRGVLPTAVVGGGALAGAGVTAGAQQLWALMDFIRAGEESEERTARSPLIQQG